MCAVVRMSGPSCVFMFVDVGVIIVSKRVLYKLLRFPYGYR